MRKTVGDLLREARNKKGLALQQIERETGIATHQLLTLELDQFSLIDPEKFDDYLKAYATAVDLDVTDLKQLYELQLTTEASAADNSADTSYDELVLKTNPDYVPGSLGSRSSRRNRSEATSSSSKSAKSNKSVAASSSAVAKSSKSSAKQLSKPAKKSSLPLILLSLVAFSIVLFVVWTLYSMSSNQEQTRPSLSSPSSSSSTPASSSTSTSTSSSSQPETTSLTVSGGGDTLNVEVANAKKPIKVDITFAGEESSWVGLTNSDLGEMGTILNTETPQHTATIKEEATEAVLSFGITQGISVKIDGQELDMSAITSTSNSVVTLTIK